MKFILNFYILIFILSCTKDENPQQIQTQGYNMLLIGNSFFRPYADHLDNLTTEANLFEHNSTVVFRGGENGRPINLWNDSNTEEHQLIKSTLDQGNIEVFGMTSGYDIDSDNPTEGHSAWINYALQNNPNIIIFIAIPTFDFPNGDSNGTRPDWDTFASDNGFNSIQEFYDYYVNEMVHKEIVDELRLEFPSTKIFTIPTGWATKNLAQMNLDNELSEHVTGILMNEERYELHNWVSKNIFVKNKEKGISQLVSETILSLRTYLINKKVDELKDEIKIENNNDKILEEINEYHKLKSLLSKKLNRVF